MGTRTTPSLMFTSLWTAKHYDTLRGLAQATINIVAFRASSWERAVTVVYCALSGGTVPPSGTVTTGRRRSLPRPPTAVGNWKQ